MEFDDSVLFLFPHFYKVMRQNYDEMRNLREQNNAMHGDVRAIKEMLKAPKTDQPLQPQQEEMAGSPNALTATMPSSPTYGRQIHGQSYVVAPKGPGRMVGAQVSRNTASENRKAYNGGTPVPPLRESTHFGIKNITGRAVGTGGGAQHNGVDSSGYYSSSSTASLSVDLPRSRAAPSKSSHQAPSYVTSKNNNAGNGNNGDGRTLPAICSLKDGVPVSRQPSSRGRPVIRKGSAVAKK